MKTYVFHHNDADGRASAAVVNKWFRESGAHGEIVFREMDYKDTPDFSFIEPEDDAVIVDFSFKPDAMAELMGRTENVVWCDHHKTAATYGYDVVGVRDFSEKGKAGCECTFEFFFPEKPMPEWLVLLGDYDAWRMQRKPDCLQFYEGLKLWNQDPVVGVWGKMFAEPSLWNKILLEGSCALQYRDNYCGELRKSFGYVTEIGGHRAYALNAYRFGSTGFGEKFMEFPVCIAYIHDGKQFTVSLYSETVDVGELAKAHGGGGHRGAAGFVCEALPWIVR